MIKICAFYTNAYYCNLASRLSLSLNKHWSGPYEITKVKGPANWKESVGYKPLFILDCLVHSACEGILYTDADSTLERIPPVGELTGDIAYHPFKRSPQHTEEALTGTMYFKNTEKVKAFVLEWAQATAKWFGTDTPEQQSFLECLAKSDLKVQKLAPEWCFIFDDMRELYPDAKEIFLHHQASRIYRQLESEGKTEEVSNVQGEGLPERQMADPSEWSRSKGRASK